MITAEECYLAEDCPKALRGDCPAEGFCPSLFKQDFLLEQSLLPMEQRRRIPLRVDADGSDQKTFERLSFIEEHIEEFVSKGRNLYIYSEICGNGKTAWATRLLQKYIKRTWPKSPLTCTSLFVHVPRFFLSLKEGISRQSDYSEHIKENVLTAKVVVWDEVGIKTLTAFEFDHLLNILNSRISARLSNIYTSNIPPESLESVVGDRLYSRIINTSECIQLVGQDKRFLGKDKDL